MLSTQGDFTLGLRHVVNLTNIDVRYHDNVLSDTKVVRLDSLAFPALL